jgi:hypothetical protein
MRAQEMSRHFSDAIEQKLGEHATYIDLVKQRDALRMRIAQLKVKNMREERRKGHERRGGNEGERKEE